MQLDKRFWEIDFLRGIAIIMMIIFHFLFDLYYFGGYDFNLWSGFWFAFGRITALIFIFLVGISLTLSYSRTIKLKKKINFPMKYVKRGIMIFGYGILITLVTFLFLESGVIVFGILHFIGVAIILAYPFIRLTDANLLFGIAFIFIGYPVSDIILEIPWLLWLGVKQTGFYTLDYFPVFPWFGFVLFGIFVGNILYRNYKRRFRFKELGSLPVIKQLCYIGRHSLLIYLIHQPVLIALLYLLVF